MAYIFPEIAANTATIDLNAAGYIVQDGQTSAGQKSVSTLYNSLSGYKTALIGKSTEEEIETATNTFFNGQRQLVAKILNNVLGTSAYNIKFEAEFKPE